MEEINVFYYFFCWLSAASEQMKMMMKTEVLTQKKHMKIDL